MDLGKVYFIGAGPGDPGLVTYKAIRKIEQADVIIYDRLVNPILLQLSKRDCKLIYVGKNPDVKYKKQEEINTIINRCAQQYKTIVRLKGGDPGIFGRLTEEVECLDEHTLYEIVPGITSASAAALYSGFPLTDRAHSPHVTFSTGHLQKDSVREIDFEALAKGGTLALYMGMKALPEIVEVLSKNDAHLKIAVIGHASYGFQKTVTGDLTNIIQKVQEEEVTHPAMIIIGDVVNCRKGVSWFESLPEFNEAHLYISTEEINKHELIERFEQGGFYYAIDQMNDVLVQEKYRNVNADVLSERTFTQVFASSTQALQLFEETYGIQFDRNIINIKG
ncbi:uroporphyrinogen-III C-methyltransferase [Macrococcoides canis]|uniref:uroporphyrinogen-III C-methyltransferase n=1 Tax=Macrococcoides canis TaxID=1855823 RepID=UPI0020B8312E|nr:uroporphyrinogen-III C-methyltransferase [Macrococcus canis]UTG99384.1 uroporphyrinogen-III C-methyltransferase [Macrococcus canis]WBF53597.1 uroporphyrinogen-III C-methyltransferase [Macrococcus canis]